MLVEGIILILLLIAAYTDWTRQKVPDYITAFMWATIGLSKYVDLGLSCFLFGACLFFNWIVWYSSQAIGYRTKDGIYHNGGISFGLGDLLIVPVILPFIINGKNQIVALFLFAIAYIIVLKLFKDKKPLIPLFVLPYIISFI